MAQQPRSAGSSNAVLLLVIVALAAGGFVALPYYTVMQMRSAIEHRDPEALSRHVDYEALRASVQEGIASELKADTTSSDEDAAAKAFSSALAGAAVEYLVTPEMVAAFLTGSMTPAPDIFTKYEQSPDARMIMEQYRDTTTPQTSPAAALKDVKLSMGFESLSRFVVRARSRTSAEGEIGLVFLRKGLSWKLSGLRVESARAPASQG